MLNSDDPIRVYERFATLDALSQTAEPKWSWGGSFTESFPLFGHRMEDYERLFEEKLEIFFFAQEEDEFDWEGTILSSNEFTPPLK